MRFEQGCRLQEVFKSLLIRKRPVKYRLKATSAVPKSAGRGGRELLDLAFPGHLLSGYYAALPLSAFQAFCQ